MRLGLAQIMEQPGQSVSFSTSMDLSDLQYGISKPVTEPVLAEGVVRNTAGINARAAVGIDRRTVCHAAGGDKQKAINCSVVRHAEGVDPHNTAIIDRSAVRNAVAEDDQVAAGFDCRVVRHATVEDAQSSVGIDRGAVCHTAAEGVHEAAGIDRSVVCNTTRGDVHFTAIIDRSAVRNTAAGNVHDVVSAGS